MKKTWMLILTISVIFLVAACGGATGSGDSGGAGDNAGLAFLDGLSAGDVVVQLDHEPGFTTPEFFQSFGRVPQFTLYADGRVIYREESIANEQYSERLVEARMEPQEMADFYNEIVEAGALSLESYTDMCAPAGGEFEECIADAATTVIRVRQEDGTIYETRHYAGFAAQRDIVPTIENRLANYKNPGAESYLPEQATLWINIAWGEPSEGYVADWPLDPELLPSGDDLPEFGLVPQVIDGASAQTLLDENQRSFMGYGAFSYEGVDYLVMVTPWLPGVDHSEAIIAYEPF